MHLRATFAAEQERLCSRTGMIAHLEAISELKNEGGGEEEGGKGQWPTSCCVSLSAGRPADGPIVKPSDLNRSKLNTTGMKERGRSAFPKSARAFIPLQRPTAPGKRFTATVSHPQGLMGKVHRQFLSLDSRSFCWTRFDPQIDLSCLHICRNTPEQLLATRLTPGELRSEAPLE